MHDQIKLEPHPGHVEIKLHGMTVADTRKALLLIETYAPDIYIPLADIKMQFMSKAKQCTRTDKGDRVFWSAQIDDHTEPDLMWTCIPRDPAFNALTDHAAFDFGKVETLIDGQRVRGHVRDPHKVITTKPLAGNLVIEHDGDKIVATHDGVILRETGLPERYYVPAKDVSPEFLIKSQRQSVCTYKGEATYYHIKTANQLLENTVWSYPDPWLDFSADLDKIRGLLAFYTSSFDRVLIDDIELEPDDATRRTDENMLSNPTIDQTLVKKLQR